ncbi:MAG: hypothetical protein BWY76_00111 [bacterium ADurb.Bin429]|nr:MAG: hypothetical protein BWY76_00111 [bacterium ADurb.Bin429]
MPQKQIVMQIGLLAAALTCGLLLWRILAHGGTDILDASLRAVGAGLAVVILTLLLCGIIDRLGGTTGE